MPRGLAPRRVRLLSHGDIPPPWQGNEADKRLVISWGEIV